MFGLNGYDPKTLSDDALLEKMTDLNEKIVWASKFGSGDLVTQLQGYLATLDLEMRTRAWERLQKDYLTLSKNVIETDPEFKQVEAQDKPEKPDTPAKQVQIMRTDKPVNPKSKNE